MPSGAKKRKAAKKKKEKEANINPSTNHPQGNNELKSQDEKGSDGSEGSSPAYHDDDDRHHPFTEENEEVEERDPSATQPSAVDGKSVEEVPGDIKIDEVVGGKEDGDVVIERGFKSEESCESQKVSVVHIESARESDYGNGNTNGSSNYETLAEKNSKDEPHNNPVKEAITFDELVESIDSSHAKMTLITENAPVEETGNSVVESSVNSAKEVASLSELKNYDTENALLEKSMACQVGATDLVTKKNEDKLYPVSDDNVRTSSLEEPKTKKYDDKTSASLPESHLTGSTNGAEHIRTSSLEEPETKEYNDKVSASLSGSHFTESTNVAEHVTDSETPESCENQPLVASAPRMVQKTSWLSCCGLFEVLSGSNR